MDNSQKKSFNIRSDLSSNIIIESIRQVMPKSSYFDSDDTHCKRLKGKQANLVFHAHTVNITASNDVVNAYTDYCYNKVVRPKIDY
jgi:hypothetical protein